MTRYAVTEREPSDALIRATMCIRPSAKIEPADRELGVEIWRDCLNGADISEPRARAVGLSKRFQAGQRDALWQDDAMRLMRDLGLLDDKPETTK